MNINQAMMKFYKEIGDMALGKPERNEVKLLVIDMLKEYHAEHIKNCPHALKMQYNWKLAGVVFVLVTAACGVGTNFGAIIKLFM